MREIYVSRFERDGWEVDSASSLLDAERRAVQLRPSVLLVSYLVLEDVKATFKRLRSLPTLLKTSIVVTAKHLSRETVDLLLLAGAKDVILTAHITPQALVKRMNQLIDDSL
jgi:DNA-binding response OmpR family regulator